MMIEQIILSYTAITMTDTAIWLYDDDFKRTSYFCFSFALENYKDDDVTFARIFTEQEHSLIYGEYDQ